jgi:hypothetical protein
LQYDRNSPLANPKFEFSHSLGQLPLLAMTKFATGEYLLSGAKQTSESMTKFPENNQNTMQASGVEGEMIA